MATVDVEVIVKTNIDNIKNPKHYTQGIECWDYIISHKMNFLEGNIIKYITRWRDKNGIEDLRKAQAYLEKLISSESPKPVSAAVCQHNDFGFCNAYNFRYVCKHMYKGICYANN